jgi:hypothetical protein
LTSTATGVAWVDPSTISAEAATLVVIECKNTSGATITKGTPVYQTGTVGATDVIEIAPADALISSGKQPAIGLLQTTLNNNGFGKVVITGEFLNFTTDPIDGVTPTTGDKVFLKSGGGLTLTKPTGAENGIQNLGLIGKVSGGNAGSITVSSIMRTNDVPNLPTGKIWVGDGNTIVSDIVFLDEPNGRMGIGTTSPQALLHLTGTVNTDTTKLYLTENTSLLGGYFKYDGNLNINYIGGLDTTERAVISFPRAGNTLNLITNNSIALHIDASRNVGIGTTSPNGKLEVNGIVKIGNVTTGLSMNGSSATEFLIAGADTGGNAWNSIHIKADGNDGLFIEKDTNNVGIGTTSPNAKLEVNVGANSLKISGRDTYIDSSIDSTNANIYVTQAGVGDFGQLAGSLVLQARTQGTVYRDIIFAGGLTSGNALMTITGEGDVGIGTTSPTSYGSTARTLEVRGASGTGTGLVRVSTADNSVGGALYAGSGGVVLNAQTNNSLSFATNNSEKMRITSGGELIINGTTSAYGVSQGYPLHVKGTSSQGYVSICRGTQNSGSEGLIVGTDSTNAYLLSRDNITLILGTNNLSHVFIKPNGNVGIGTSSPSEKLDVAGNINLSGVLYVGSRGIYQAQNTDVSGLELVANASINLYRAAFFDYVIQKQGNVRAGTVFACNDGVSVEYTETSTNDIGDTSDVVLSVDISGTNMRLLADAATSGWSVKSLIRAI